MRYAIHLELKRSSEALTSQKAPDIDGQVSWCAPRIASTTSRVTGTADRSASNIRLNVYEPAHPLPALRPSTLHGAWHGSRLALRVLFEQYNSHAYVFALSIPDEYSAVPLTLHKGGYGAYRAMCARI